MEAYELWDKYRNVIRSYNGGWRVGDGVYCHGYSIMDDLVGNISYMQMVILNATGRLPERRIADWFEARQICVSWPDPRIWCNQIGALAGTMRTSVAAATTAGVLASDSHAYGGPRTTITGIAFIQEALRDFNKGISIDEIIKQSFRRRPGKPRLMGYGRPIAKGDERVGTMEKISRKLGFETGPYLQLAYEIEKKLHQKFGEKMNLNGYSSAFLSDLDFSAEEISRISSIQVASGVTACYIDTMKRPAETFNALQCNDIVYTGPSPRQIKQVT